MGSCAIYFSGRGIDDNVSVLVTEIHPIIEYQYVRLIVRFKMNIYTRTI